MNDPIQDEWRDYSFEVTEEFAGERLDKFLATQFAAGADQKLEVSRSRLQRWIAEGAVQVDDIVRLPKHKLQAGEVVQVQPLPGEDSAAFTPESLDLDVLYEDKDVLVINKQAGLVTHPAPGNWSGTLLNGLLFRWPDQAKLPRAGIVHRLDKDTSGLMVIARTEKAMQSLSEQLADRTMGRRYLALVHGKIAPHGTIDQPVGRHPSQRLRMAVVGRGKPAVTRWRLLSHGTIGDSGDGPKRWVSLIECKLQTGRTHQIRVHMEHQGHPLLGDLVYGLTPRVWLEPETVFARQALHAWNLQFARGPAGHRIGLDGSRLIEAASSSEATGSPEFQAAPPRDFEELCLALGIQDPTALVQNRAAELFHDD